MVRKTVNKKHFNYRRVILYFVYSFSWDVSKISFNQLCSKTRKNAEWQELPLFNRPVSWGSKDIQTQYQPNIFSQNLLVLHQAFSIDQEAVVYVPHRKGRSTKKAINSEEHIPAKISCDIRLYENGSGNCTFSFFLDDSPTYEQIQYLLHLSSGISFTDLEHQVNYEATQHLTHTYLLSKSENNNNYPVSDQGHNKISLSDLFKHTLSSRIEKICPLYDKQIIRRKESEFLNWQIPYTLTLAELSKTDYRKFENNPTREQLKEIGSVALRLNADNSQILSEYLNLKREYIFNALGYFICNDDKKHKHGVRLKNYSHHSNLFYSFGKRWKISSK